MNPLGQTTKTRPDHASPQPISSLAPYHFTTQIAFSGVSTVRISTTAVEVVKPIYEVIEKLVEVPIATIEEQIVEVPKVET